jgi:hypothetical protein
MANIARNGVGKAEAGSIARVPAPEIEILLCEDQMQIEMGGGLAIDLLEEGQELVCPMVGQTFADDFAGRDV